MGERSLDGLQERHIPSHLRRLTLMDRVDVVEMASSLAISKSKVDRDRKEDFDDLQLQAEIDCATIPNGSQTLR